MNDGAAFGSWLRKRRKARDLTQENLADRIGCSPETIRKIEAGRRRPSRQMVEVLARYLGAPAEEWQSLIELARLGSDTVESALPVWAGDASTRQALHVPDVPPTNLLAWRTPFIGREKERAHVRELLSQGNIRLLTLIGPPGIGKTRLSFQAAEDLIPKFSDGVFWVALSPIRDASLVAPAIAHALGVKEVSNQPLDQTLKEYFRPKQMLLVLDNFEQVISAGPLVGELLVDCPRLTILVTSRATLHIYGEHQFTVPPLATPGPKVLSTFEELAHAEAVELFTQRSQAVKSSFALTAKNAPVVAEICRQLDGLPLAIELAAARSNILPPEALLARLNKRLDLLTAGMLDLPPRQQTLRGAIAWSYDLLDDDEKALYRRMSVFLGGATLEEIEAVVGGWDGAGGVGARHASPLRGTPIWMNVLDLLASLADKSLLRQDEASGEPRFWMLWTIREYGLECLAQSGEEAEIKRNHARFFLSLAEQAEPFLKGPEQPKWLQRLEDDHANLLAALEWSKEADEESCARQVAAMWRFWYIRGYLNEGRRWFETALSLDGALPASLRARLRYGAGMIISNQGDYARATVLFNESIALYQQLGDNRGISTSLESLGVLACHQGDYNHAILLFNQSLSLQRELGDKRSIAGTLSNLAHVASVQGNYEFAYALLEEGLGIFSELGVGDMKHMAISLNNLGHVARNRGNYEAALSLYEESLSIKRELGDKEGIASSLNGKGMVARQQKDYEAAASLFEESLDIFRELGEKVGITMALNNLGHVARDVGDFKTAHSLYRESLAMLHALGDKQGTAVCLLGLADVASVQDRPHQAARFLAVTETLLKAIGATLEPALYAEYSSSLLEVRNTLGEEVFQAEWSAGLAMTLGQATTLALQDARQAPPGLSVAQEA